MSTCADIETRLFRQIMANGECGPRRGIINTAEHETLCLVTPASAERLAYMRRFGPVCVVIHSPYGAAVIRGSDDIAPGVVQWEPTP